MQIRTKFTNKTNNGTLPKIKKWIEFIYKDQVEWIITKDQEVKRIYLQNIAKDQRSGNKSEY